MKRKVIIHSVPKYQGGSGVINPNLIAPPVDNTAVNNNKQVVINPTLGNTYGYASKQLGISPVLDSMLVENGAPNINTQPLGVGSNARPYYNVNTNTLHIGDSPDNTQYILDELAHAKQYKPYHDPTTTVDSPSGVVNAHLKGLRRLYGLISKEDSIIKANSPIPVSSYYVNAADSIRYKTPGTIEHDAHSVIQPALQKELVRRSMDYIRSPRGYAVYQEKYNDRSVPLLPNVAGRVIHNMNTPASPSGVIIKQLGGYTPDIVPQQQLSPLQAELKEYVIHPNYDVTKVAATLPHSKMGNEVTDTLAPAQTDEVGNIISPGAYIVSNDKKLKISRDQAATIPIGIEPAYYSEDVQLPQAKEITAADLLFSGNKNVKKTPAELLKYTLKKYSKAVRNENEDIFAKKSNMKNKQARVLPLELIKMLNDGIRAQHGGQISQDPAVPPEYQFGGIPGIGQDMWKNISEALKNPALRKRLGLVDIPSSVTGPTGPTIPTVSGAINVLSPAEAIAADASGTSSDYSSVARQNEAIQESNRLESQAVPSLEEAQRRNVYGQVAPSYIGEPIQEVPSSNLPGITLPNINSSFSVNKAPLAQFSQTGKESGGLFSPEYMKYIEDMTKKTLGAIGTDLPPEASVYPQLYNMAGTAGALFGIGAQDPISDVYTHNPAILNEAYKENPIYAYKALMDNAEATNNQRTAQASLMAGVRPQDIPILVGNNQGIQQRNSMLADILSRNRDIRRSKAQAMLQNDASRVQQNNLNKADRNRKIGQIGQAVAQGFGNMANIGAKGYEFKLARDNNMISVLDKLLSTKELLRLFSTLKNK